MVSGEVWEAGPPAADRLLSEEEWSAAPLAEPPSLPGAWWAGVLPAEVSLLSEEARPGR